MRSLSARDLLDVWEWGGGRHAVDRALALLAVACPTKTWGDLAALPVGRRDALLLSLREVTFGRQMDGFAECPQCGERLEFVLKTDDLRGLGPSGSPEPELVARVGGFTVRARAPNSTDLAEAARSTDVSSARGVLIRQCVLEACQGDTDVEADSLPDGVIEALARGLVEQDPLMDVQIDLQCPECKHGWQMVFDVLAFFWAEIQAQAKRLLREVHALARAYGWGESDVLALSARRRQWYLEMVS